MAMFLLFVLLVAIIIFWGLIFHNGLDVVSDYSKRYSRGVPTDVSSTEELKNKIKNSCFGITEIIVKNDAVINVVGKYDTYIVYLEEGKAKTLFPEPLSTFSKLEFAKFTLNASSNINKVLEISQILESLNRHEPLFAESENQINQKRIKRVNFSYKAIILAVVALVFFIVGTAITNNSDNNESHSYNNDYFYIGDTVLFTQENSTKEFTLCFTECGTYEEFNETYFYVEYEVENTGDQTVYFNDYDIQCFSNDYSVNRAFVMYGDNNSNLTLSPGRKVKSSVYFDVNYYATNSLELGFSGSIWIIK